MKNGFRVPPQGSKKEQLQELKTELANMQMAGRISQMMTQQLMKSVQSMSDDLGFALNQLQDLQYKHNAALKLLKVNDVDLTTLANEQRLVDFNESSAKADVKENLAVGETVEADSTVVLTSEAKDEAGNDRGIFRSRVLLKECGVPDLISGLSGKKVGDKVQVKLNGVDHTVELLAVRNPVPATTEATPEVSH